VFPEDTRPPIIYPAALTADRTDPVATRLFDFLASPAARPIFEKRGFIVLRSGAPSSDGVKELLVGWSRAVPPSRQPLPRLPQDEDIS
jgi:hypothetical protein